MSSVSQGRGVSRSFSVALGGLQCPAFVSGLQRLRAASIALLVGALLGATAIAADGRPCHTLVPMDADRPFTHPTPDLPAQIVRLEVPDSGLVLLELVEPPGSTAPLRLDLLDGACGGLEHRTRALDRTAQSLTLVVPQAGPHDLWIAPKDPRRTVGPYRLVPRFVRLEARHEALAFDPTGGLAEAPGWLTGSSTVLRWPTDGSRTAKTELEEVEPNPGGDPRLATPPVWERDPWVAQWVRLDGGNPLAPPNGWKTELEEVEPNPGGEPKNRSTIELLIHRSDTAIHGTPRPAEPQIWAQVAWPTFDAAKTELEEVEPNPGGLWAEGMGQRPPLRSVGLPGGTPLSPTENDRRWRKLLESFQNPGQASSGWHPSQPLGSTLAGCNAQTLEDPDQLFGCANPLALGGSTEGQLEARWETDLDTFSFSLDELTTIELSLADPVSATATLYDRNGQELALAPSNLEAVDGGLRHVETLAAGRYFVRIAGPGASGRPYRLMLRRLSH